MNRRGLLSRLLVAPLALVGFSLCDNCGRHLAPASEMVPGRYRCIYRIRMNSLRLRGIKVG